MKKYILLLRGINVGGHNKIKMQALRELLSSLSLHNVETYIQSGNVVFDLDKATPAGLEDEIANAIEKHHGFRPRILILSLEQLLEAMDKNPFPEAEAEPRSLHLFFLDPSPSTPDMEKMEEIRKDKERFRLEEGVFFLHAPDGIGRSKLASNVEKLLGVEATARNWRTVLKLKEMAEPSK